MHQKSNYEPFFDYSKRLPDQTISGFDRNNRKEVKQLINEVLPDVLNGEVNIIRAGMILEGMLEETFADVTNRGELKKFLTDHLQQRTETFKKICRGLEALKGK